MYKSIQEKNAHHYAMYLHNCGTIHWSLIVSNVSVRCGRWFLLTNSFAKDVILSGWLCNNWPNWTILDRRIVFDWCQSPNWMRNIYQEFHIVLKLVEFAYSDPRSFTSQLQLAIPYKLWENSLRIFQRISAGSPLRSSKAKKIRYLLGHRQLLLIQLKKDND